MVMHTLDNVQKNLHKIDPTLYGQLFWSGQK